MPIELKPCPYCGNMPTITFWERVMEHGMWQVMCISCHTKPKVFGRGRTKERAIERWNRRADDAND
jgi:Lar family restriction alleviation protein